MNYIFTDRAFSFWFHSEDKKTVDKKEKIRLASPKICCYFIGIYIIVILII